jgi:TRAP-type C4-dicarboxylate transport system substrate-binding protein
MNRLAATATIASLVLAAAALAGCGGAGTDKLGGVKREPIVLTLANSTGDARELQPFVDEVSRLSHGAVQIEVVNDWREGEVAYETGIIHDVQAGKADLGWVGGRAWGAVGITSFDALQAPFLIDSYALEERVIESVITDRMLRHMPPGLRGVGVLPGPFRYLLAASRPLLTPSDVAGLRVGFQGASEPEESLRALGAKPVRLARGAWPGIDAAEQQLDAMYQNNYYTHARYITANVSLWPRPLVLFMNTRAGARLASSQRSVLREAARRAGPATLAAVTKQEKDALVGLCRRGISLATATPADVARFHAAVAPVYRTLERQSATASFIAEIKRLGRNIGASSGPTTACPSAPSPSASSLPDGRYSVTITRVDARRAGFPQMTFGTFTLVLQSGNFTLYQQHHSGDFAGTYSIYRDRIVATGSNGDVLTARWSLAGTRLRFTDVKPARSPYSLVWETHPWQAVRGSASPG